MIGLPTDRKTDACWRMLIQVVRVTGSLCELLRIFDRNVKQFCQGVFVGSVAKLILAARLLATFHLYMQ